MSECQADMEKIISLFSELGVPLAEDKLVGPVEVITYLGIEIDTVRRVVSLPIDKFEALMVMLDNWHGRKKCTKRELLSLIGSLSFACKVIKPGRIFLRRLIDLSMTVEHLGHHITLNAEARADIQWWLDFLPDWNGRESFQGPCVTSYSIKFFTDASSVGYGAVFGKEWLYGKWPDCHANKHINYLELLSICIAVFTWGDSFRNQQVIVFTDNLVICNVWRSGSCSNKDIMHLIRKLFMFTAKLNLNVLMQHVAGQYNVLADALSRLQVDRFKRLHTTASPSPASHSLEGWDH